MMFSKDVSLANKKVVISTPSCTNSAQLNKAFSDRVGSADVTMIFCGGLGRKGDWEYLLKTNSLEAEISKHNSRVKCEIVSLPFHDQLEERMFIDQRTWNKSTAKVFGEVEFQNLYAELENKAVEAQQKGKKIVIVGFSTGCLTSTIIATKFPDVVAGLIFFSPPIKVKDTLTREVFRLSHFLIDSANGLLGSFLGDFSLPFSEINQAEKKYFHSKHENVNFTSFKRLSLKWLSAFRKAQIKTWFYASTIKSPILVFYGKEDWSVSQKGVNDFLSKATNSSYTEMVEFNAGHWVKLSSDFVTHGKSRLLDLVKNFHKDNSIDLTTSSI